jgi:hypothetical protein
MEKVRMEFMRAAGVTFEGRQERVEELQTGAVSSNATPPAARAGHIVDHGACVFQPVHSNIPSNHASQHYLPFRSPVGQPLIFVKEPTNPYDPNAVHIMTVGGIDLGYVPKELTFKFLFDETFGLVNGVGREGSMGNWGFSVAVVPTVPSPAVLAMPTNIGGLARLQDRLAGRQWENLKGMILEGGSARRVTSIVFSFDLASWVCMLGGNNSI